MEWAICLLCARILSATVATPLEGMNKFWKGGIQNLDEEMETYELLLAAGEESTDEIPETPTIPVFT